MAEWHEVHLGTRALQVGHHWALKVGDCWYEVNATTNKNTHKEKNNGEKVKVDMSWGECSKGEAQKGGAHSYQPSPLESTHFNSSCGGTASLLGKTKKTHAQIQAFNVGYEKDNPTYNLVTANCQSYVTALFEFLMELPDGERHQKNRLPFKQSFLS